MNFATSILNQKKNPDSLKRAKHGKIGNVAGSVLLSML
jgi:argininosuccinate lyase